MVQFDNFTDKVVGYALESLQTVAVNLANGYDDGDFDLPRLDVDFDLAIKDLPESELQVAVKGFEMYVELDNAIMLGATHIIDLFTSRSLFNIRLGDRPIGCFLVFDLILDGPVQTAFEGGFHMKIEDGFAMNVPLFCDKVGSIKS